MEEVAGGATGKTTRKILDFLYRDLGRLDSIYAQLFQGNLTRVVSEESTGQTSDWAVSGGIGLLEATHSTSEDTIRSRTREVQPHDQKILSLLDFLQIPLLQQPLNTTQTGQIVLVKGTICIRDYNAFRSLFPKLINAGLLDEIAATSHAPGKASKKEYKMFRKQFSGVLEIIPGGIELEVRTELGEILIGSLHAEYLTERPEDLLRIYGNVLPGEWLVLGTIEHLQENTSRTSAREFALPLDQYSKAIRDLYAAGGKYAIVPILVFKELHW